MKRAISLFVAVALAAGLLALPLGSAEAAFPGSNGKIVFWSGRSATTTAGPGLYTTIVSGTATEIPATKIPGTSSGDSQAVWSPDGSRIVFQSSNGTANKEISVMNADGSGRRQLTNTSLAGEPTEQEPTWSPDGTRIAFAANDSDTDTTTDLEIWEMNADGSGLTQLTNTAQGVRDTQPAWSPLGNQIAFVSEGRCCPNDGNSSIYVMDTDPTTNDASNLTPNDFTTNPVYQYNDEDPTWSPDGTQIAYSTIADVWKRNADGTGEKNLTLSSGGGSQPAWSPDGNSIVYVRRDPDFNIAVMDTNGDTNDSGNVDTTVGKDEKPDWQPIPVCTNINATSGNDVITGTAGKDVLCGGDGNDTISGAGGNDIILGEAGNDSIVGGSENDILNGGSGLDTALYTGTAPVTANLTTQFATGVGSDTLPGIERLTGSSAGDRLTGSLAANVLVGGTGPDILSGLGGRDTLKSRDGAKNDTVNGGPGTDRCTTDNREISIRSCE